MNASEAPSLATLIRRDVVRASVTHLATRLRELESKVGAPTIPSLAHRMSVKLDTLDSDFKAHHFAVINAITEGNE